MPKVIVPEYIKAALKGYIKEKEVLDYLSNLTYPYKQLRAYGIICYDAQFPRRKAYPIVGTPFYLAFRPCKFTPKIPDRFFAPTLIVFHRSGQKLCQKLI